MEYIELTCKIEPLNPGCDILIAELGEIGYESFVETEEGIQAYIQSSLFSEEALKNISIIKDIDNFKTEYSFKTIADTNWNAVWESNFEPVIIDDKCLIRAPFHIIEKKYELEIVIEPKMSFGTAHHETTYLMLQYLFELDLKNKKLLDMGCGTSILAIAAAKLGSNDIDAIDNDEWAYNNSIENVEKNDTKQIKVYLGDANLLEKDKYEIILANINRNILLNDIQTYAKCLENKAFLLMSGFYTEDLEVIKECCAKNNIGFISNKVKNNWVSALFQKL